jgi:hypothetical protein
MPRDAGRRWSSCPFSEPVATTGQPMHRAPTSIRSVRRHFNAAVAVLSALLVGSPVAAQSPREIIDRVDQLMRGESSHGRVEMQIETEHWSRSLEMEVWSLGTDYSLVRVSAPAREAGTATLESGREVGNYLPLVDRTVKAPPSLGMGAWMGSHLTNDDLAAQASIQVHPLVAVDALLLGNLHDGSALLAPGLSWSVSSAASMRPGGFASAGAEGRSPAGGLRSAYGSTPAVWYASLSC